MMKSLVSVIITTHNRCDLLARAIESVLSQTYCDIECIVVDDASTDGTFEVCKRYPVVYVHISKEESHGGNYARNLGIKASKGEYCAFLDDDDYWLPEKVAKQMEIADDKKCSLVYCLRKYEIVKNGQIVGFRDEPARKPSGDLSKIIFKRYITNTSCILAKKSLILDVGGFDEGLRKWQEYDLMIRLAEKTQVYYADEMLCVYRLDSGDTQKISNDFDRVMETIVKIRMKYSKRIEALPLSMKIHFYGTCMENIYKLAKKNNHYLRWLGLYFPMKVLYLYKMIDDFKYCNRKMIQTRANMVKIKELVRHLGGVIL